MAAKKKAKKPAKKKPSVASRRGKKGVATSLYRGIRKEAGYSVD